MDAKQLSLNEAREAARRLGARVRTIKKNADTIAERTTMLLLGSVSAFGTGYYMGGLEVEREAAIQAAGGNEDAAFAETGDPTTWFGMPRDLVIGAGVAAAAFTNLGGKRINSALTSGSFGIFCGWAGNAGRQMGREAAVEA